uniref:Periostin, osteoblast specific factor a n=1 Tax=Dicentrarchus labrax TaxID=13489 RepID=A0A8C4GII8_DICLA
MHQLLAVTLVLVTLCSLGSVDSSAYDKIVSHSRIRARKEGPNVCALQQVMGTKKKYFSTCRNWYKGSICGKKAVVLYECCPGYMKLEGARGCPAVAPIDHVYGTLGLIKATTTQQYADMSKLREEIEGKGSFTMFAPSNEAWDQLDPTIRSALVSNVNIELFNSLHFHMVNRRLLTKEMKNDMSVTSMYNNLGLYINHYSNGIVTVNCARIIHGNQIATNGVVHVIDRVISAVGSTIKEVLDVNDDLSSFNAVALTSGLMDKLDQPGHYTLFAPTNKAFDRLGPGYLERIMGDKAVITALANYHLLNSVQCSEAIMAGSVYETAEGSTIEIGCDGDSLTVNGIKMVLKKDIVATNGVIHLIDQVLVPDSAKEGKELLGDLQSTFSDMVSELGLASLLGPKTEYTLLAPVNAAFTTEVMSTDQSLLRLILENHILKLKITLSELYNGQLLETLAGKLLRVFIYRTAVCIENACMQRGSKVGSNGALHVMKSFIKPAEKTMYELLIADGRFKIFLSLMETAGLTDLLKQEGSYTIFAPTDDAFDGLSREDLYAVIQSYIMQGEERNISRILALLYSMKIGECGSVLNVTFLSVILKRCSCYLSLSTVPDVTKVTRIIEGEPTVTKVTRVIETEPTVTKVVIEGEPVITKVTRVVQGDPSITKVTRVIEGDPSITKVTRVIEGDPSITKVTRVIEGDPSLTKVTRLIEGDPSLTKVTRVIEGDPSITKVTRVIEGDPSVTKVTRVIGGQPTITKVTRVIEGKTF